MTLTRSIHPVREARCAGDPGADFARPDLGTGDLVASIQDELIGWAAIEMEERCRTAWRDAERLLGVTTVLGMVVAGEARVGRVPIRTVRDPIGVIAASFRRDCASSQLPLPFDCLSPAARYERDWRAWYLAELCDLAREPDFVRSTLIAILHPDTDLQLRSTAGIVGLLRCRYGLGAPARAT